jgi:hypothetical protein
MQTTASHGTCGRVDRAIEVLVRSEEGSRRKDPRAWDPERRYVQQPGKPTDGLDSLYGNSGKRSASDFSLGSRSDSSGRDQLHDLRPSRGVKRRKEPCELVSSDGGLGDGEEPSFLMRGGDHDAGSGVCRTRVFHRGQHRL